jgi:group I intron endonuclease
MISKHPTSQFVEEHERRVEIYIITCSTTKKSYVGQAVTHILNRKKYQRYGMKKRFDCHISEAFSSKKNQCHYLNSAIRKYGEESFELMLLDVCKLRDGDEVEEFYIKIHNTLFPNGYNLKTGTITTYLTLKGRQRVSKGVQRYYWEKRLEKFKDVKVDITKIENYIKPSRLHGEQIGYYIKIEGKITRFGGSHVLLEDAYKSSIQFLTELANKK